MPRPPHTLDRLVTIAIALALLLPSVACGRALATHTPAPLPTATAGPTAAAEPTALPRAPQPAGGAITEADGYIADDEPLSPFAVAHPAIGNLDPALRAAIQRASRDAARDGVTLSITSGWRSARYQQALLDEAIATYGSEAEARRWVNTPERSTHVTGNAVDVGPLDAGSWLSQHGNAYGLCQIYANELWHYELATAPGGVCPQQLGDASVG